MNGLYLFFQGISSWSFLTAFIVFFGYILNSSFLQFFYYSSSASSPISLWKIQPNITRHVGKYYGMPLFSRKPNRGPYHRLFTSLNLCNASLFAFLVTELSMRKMTFMRFDAIEDYGLGNVVFDFIVSVVFQSVAEYYWHRLMHTNVFYSRLHKYHHFYKSPEVWDDMYIHPLEAIGYYFILYGPPLYFRCHVFAFVAYMIVMGVCGVMDHSGIKFQCGIYSTDDHDAHHSKFEVNYSFPFPFMDILHCTYEGIFFGKEYHKAKRF